MNDIRAAQTAQEFYEGLDPRELAAVAGSCSLSLEDVRQEAWLACLLIAAGRSDHDPARGSVRQHVMGWLWRLTLRWQAPVRLGRGQDGNAEEPRAPGDAAWECALLARSPYMPDPEAADPLQVLLAREADQIYEVTCQETLDHRVATGALTHGERTFLELILAGAPAEELAELYGLTPRAVRYRCDRLRRKVEEAPASRPAPPGQ